MTPRRRILIEIVRRTAAILCWVVAGRFFWQVASGIFKNWKGELTDYVFLFTIGLIFVVAIPAGLAWIGWRLWAQWNASTVRWAIGTLVAFLIIFIASGISSWFPAAAQAAPTKTIVPLITIPLLVIGAMAYRWTTRAIGRIAEFDEILEVYGQPPGHAGRVKLFAFILGWAVWMGGSEASQWIKISGMPQPQIEALASAASMILGWGTYRLTTLLMRPRTKSAQPAVHAFEVVILPKKPQ